MRWFLKKHQRRLCVRHGTFRPTCYFNAFGFFSKAFMHLTKRPHLVVLHFCNGHLYRTAIFNRRLLFPVHLATITRKCYCTMHILLRLFASPMKLLNGFTMIGTCNRYKSNCWTIRFRWKSRRFPIIGPTRYKWKILVSRTSGGVTTKTFDKTTPVVRCRRVPRTVKQPKASSDTGRNGKKKSKTARVFLLADEAAARVQ